MDINSTVKLHTGSQLPVLGLGTWQLSKDTADTIAMALQHGYKMIDTSGDYGTQPGIAEGVKKKWIAARRISYCHQGRRNRRRLSGYA